MKTENIKLLMKLTANFSKHEFDSRDGSAMPADVLARIKVLAHNLQILRNHVGKSITINSGYRSPSHNKKIGGVANSQHVKGNAADIVVSGMTPKEVYLKIIDLQNKKILAPGGVGLYDTFVHFDIRGYNARFNNSTIYKS
ncbi:MAG: D-Ala-D-Ala carboxypeptidase family metallohydrolase [Weeksellaceae bacterium]